MSVNEGYVLCLQGLLTRKDCRCFFSQHDKAFSLCDLLVFVCLLFIFNEIGRGYSILIWVLRNLFISRERLQTGLTFGASFCAVDVKVF